MNMGSIDDCVKNEMKWYKRLFRVFKPNQTVTLEEVQDAVMKLEPCRSLDDFIFESIHEARRMDRVILSLGIPLRIQKELGKNKNLKGKRIIEYYGIPVRTSKNLSITLEISPFRRIHI